MPDQIIGTFLTVMTPVVPVRGSSSVHLLFYVESVVFYFPSLSVFPFFIMRLLLPASVPFVSSVASDLPLIFSLGLLFVVCMPDVGCARTGLAWRRLKHFTGS